MPPKQDDLAARMDPTKIRARGFNTGKGAKTAVGDDNSAWNETPEEKRKRLQDEMMGISKSSAVGPQAAPHSSTRDRAAAQKIREQTVSLHWKVARRWLSSVHLMRHVGFDADVTHRRSCEDPPY